MAFICAYCNEPKENQACYSLKASNGVICGKCHEELHKAPRKPMTSEEYRAEEFECADRISKHKWDIDSRLALMDMKMEMALISHDIDWAKKIHRAKKNLLKEREEA